MSTVHSAPVFYISASELSQTRLDALAGIIQAHLTREPASSIICLEQTVAAQIARHLAFERVFVVGEQTSTALPAPLRYMSNAAFVELALAATPFIKLQ